MFFALPYRTPVAAILVFAAFANTLTLLGDEQISLQVVEPAYRNTIFATQIDQKIVVRAVLKSEQKVCEIKGKLLDANGRELLATKAGLRSTDEISFDAKGLPYGNLGVEVHLLGSNGETTAIAKTVIRKLPESKGSEVWIDRNRNIIVNGKPSIQIGWYGTVPLEDPRPDVIALQNVQTPVVVIYPNKNEVVSAFRNHGIRSIVSLEPGRLLSTFELWKTPGNKVPTEHKTLSAPSAEIREMVKKVVNLLRDEPGLLGWYIADEPEINDTRADYLEAQTQSIAAMVHV